MKYGTQVVVIGPRGDQNEGRTGTVVDITAKDSLFQVRFYTHVGYTSKYYLAHELAEAGK
jgi:hypothetical protein